MARNNTIKTFFQKFYALVIAPLIKAFNWLRRFFGRQETPNFNSTARKPQTDTGVLKAGQEQIQPNAEQAQPEAFKKQKAEAIAENRVSVYTAIAKGDISIVEEYLKKAPQEEIQATSSNLLYIAVSKGHIEVVELLMKYKVDLNCDCTVLNNDRYRCKHSALYLAIKHLRPNMVKFLLNHKVKITPDARNYFINFDPGKMEVHSNENFEIIATLFLEAQLDTIVLHPDKKGGDFFLLLYAIRAGHIDIVKRTLDHLNPRQHTKFYSPYRHDASIVAWALRGTHNKEIIQALLVHYQAHLDFLRNAGYNPYTPGPPEEDLFRIAVEEANNIEAAKILIHDPHVKLKLSYKYPDDYPREYISSSVLYRAMENKNHEMVAFLIEAGVTLGQRLYIDEQLEVIDNYKKNITFMYSAALKCLDPVIPERGIKNIIVDYAIPYLEPESNMKLRRKSE